MRKYTFFLAVLCMILCAAGLGGCRKNDKNPTSEDVTEQHQGTDVQQLDIRFREGDKDRWRRGSACDPKGKYSLNSYAGT